MKVGIVKETFPGERRVALTPAEVPKLARAGSEVMMQAGAGQAAGFPDAQYKEKGVQITEDRHEVLRWAEILAQVRAFGANPDAGRADLEFHRPAQVIIGFCEPLREAVFVRELADRKVTLLAMELVPRITRAQSMDALSSMASIAGYKAVLLAADALPKMFPMMMTAAGTITPAKVFVIGAGVAGLQAIATAKRLGAVVEAYDLRPAVKEQVQSLGAKFVELPLETGQAEDKGGYAKAMDEAFYHRQREMMTRVVAEVDVVITTAAVPGRKAPVLITEPMVKGMKPGSVIVDLAAESGGNCELTRAGETIDVEGVTIIGAVNLPSTVAYHASQSYARNVTTLLLHLVKDAKLTLNPDDEITKEIMVCRNGEIVDPRVRQLLEPAPSGTGAAAESKEGSES